MRRTGLNDGGERKYIQIFFSLFLLLCVRESVCFAITYENIHIKYHFHILSFRFVCCSNVQTEFWDASKMVDVECCCIKILCAKIFRQLTHFAVNCRCRVGRWGIHSITHPTIPWTHSCICGGNRHTRADAQNAKQRNGIRRLIGTQFPEPAGDEMRDFVLDRLFWFAHLFADCAKLQKRWKETLLCG